jgi:hypothetical protein
MVIEETKLGTPLEEQLFVVRSMLQVLGLLVEDMVKVRRACVECLDKPEEDRFKLCLEQLDEFKYDAVALQRVSIKLHREITIWLGMLKVAGKLEEPKIE